MCVCVYTHTHLVILSKIVILVSNVRFKYVFSPQVQDPSVLGCLSLFSEKVQRI